jgi:hypothetical protein
VEARSAGAGGFSASSEHLDRREAEEPGTEAAYSPSACASGWSIKLKGRARRSHKTTKSKNASGNQKRSSLRSCLYNTVAVGFAAEPLAQRRGKAMVLFAVSGRTSSCPQSQRKYSNKEKEPDCLSTGGTVTEYRRPPRPSLEVCDEIGASFNRHHQIHHMVQALSGTR